MYCVLFYSRRKKREFWVSPGRTDLWWQNLLLGKMPQMEWCKNFRMDYDTFSKLVNSISHLIEPHTDSFRPDTISAEKKVAMVIYYLKDQGSLRMTANIFGVSVSTLSNSLRAVCKSINEVLGPKLIKFPETVDEIKDATARFEKRFGFPQALGCVDGTHIPIKQPEENAQDYFCYKMKYSLNCQAVCDEIGRFIAVEIRWPGSVHDARVFTNSSVAQKLKNNEAFHQSIQELIPGYRFVPPNLNR